MSEIDPWALPRDGANDAGAGIPGAAPRPLNTGLPILVMVLGVFYSVVSLVEIFMLRNQASLAGTLINATDISQDQINQAQHADNLVDTVSWAALIIFLATLFAIGAWQRSLNRTLGSVGARRAVFNRAGYVYFRATWLVSILLSFFLSFTSDSAGQTTIQGLIDHDHEYMIYYGVRAVVGLVLIFFAFRLKKISEEGVARLGGAYL